MKTILYVCFVSLCLLTACAEKEKTASFKDLTNSISLAIDQLSDSSFFCNVTSIDYKDGKYYISDYERGNIFVLDKQLNLINTLGIKGKGPGELLGASQLFVHSADSVLIYNDGKKSIELFDQERHQSTITLPDDFEFNPDIRFCYENNNLYLSSFNGTNSISKSSLVSNTLSWFGDIREHTTDKESRIKNRRHLSLYGKDRIIAIPDCQAKIELYTLVGEKVSEFSLDTIPIINDILSFVDKQKKEPNSYYQFFQDAYVHGSDIFILILSVDKEDKIESNKIIQIEIDDDKIKSARLLYLGDGWYNKFCVTSHSIVAFDAKACQLIKYNL